MDYVNVPGILNFLPDNVRKILKATDEQTHCVAGGFARKLARIKFGIGKYTYEQFMFDLQTEKHDIDVFELEKGNSHKILNQTKRYASPVKQTHSAFWSYGESDASRSSAHADNYFVSGVKIQHIRQCYANIKHVFDNFDLCNCCVAFAKDQLIFKNFAEWRSLETENVIRVKKWDPGTPCRVLRYIEQYGYFGVENYDDLLIQLAKNASAFLIWTKSDSHVRLTNDDILKISIFGDPDRRFNHAWKYLMNHLDVNGM